MPYNRIVRVVLPRVVLGYFGEVARTFKNVQNITQYI